MFAFTTQHVVIKVPERTSDCPEPKAFKTFFHKKHIAIPMRWGRDKRLTGGGFGSFFYTEFINCLLKYEERPI